MRRVTTLILALATIGLMNAGCGEEEPPPRDQIPVIKEAVYNLQQAVKDRNRYGLDSLLSARILENGQSGDSLLNFCFGPQSDFAFNRFGDCEIVYTKTHAIARCYVMDSTNTHDRPIRLTFVHEEVGPTKDRKSLWLLSTFDQKPLSSDTTDTIDSAAAGQ